MSRIYDFTYTGSGSGVHSQVQQYDRLDRAVTQVQYYFDSVRDWRHDVVSYATQARQDRDHIQTLGDTIASTGQHIDTRVQVAIDAADTATTAASNTATDRQSAQDARVGAETAETNAKSHASDAASSASSAADILTATEALGITVDTTVGTRVFVGDTMIYGDTGWRDISDRFTGGWTGRLIARRMNSTVEIRFTELNGSQATQNSMTTSVTPFVSSHGRLTAFALDGDGGSAQTQMKFLSTSGSFNQLWRGQPGDFNGSGAATAVFTTTYAWPTALPGTPV